MKMKIYVASSWRNSLQQRIVRTLREAGHEVYDFMNPPGRTGFAWGQIDKDHEGWGTTEYSEALEHPLAEGAFRSDFDAMRWADAGVLVLPCGRSAHAEAGWMKGVGKKVVIYHYDGVPELMYKLFDCHVVTTRGLLAYLESV
jgi:hypothetical protein